MSDATKGEITQLVRRWSEGDSTAFDQLIELVYDDLRRIAHHHLDIGARGTVDTTALVHEAYLKLARAQGGTFDGRAQFFAFCSKAMRRILIDYARRRSAAKRGGEQTRVPLTDDAAVVDAEVTRMLGGVGDEPSRLLQISNPPEQSGCSNKRWFESLCL